VEKKGVPKTSLAKETDKSTGSKGWPGNQGRDDAQARKRGTEESGGGTRTKVIVLELRETPNGGTAGPRFDWGYDSETVE